jgi:hypothetical protein
MSERVGPPRHRRHAAAKKHELDLSIAAEDRARVTGGRRTQLAGC